MRRREISVSPRLTARTVRLAGIVAVAALAVAASTRPAAAQADNAILFIGDGMGVSTVSFTRFAAVGVDGQLVIDQMPYTALSRTSSSDHFTPDSAATMTAMTTGVNTNSGVIGYPPTTERNDFNGDGDGARLTTIAEMMKARGYNVGVVTTARITHATPAAVYAHVNDRNIENDIAAQLTPGGPGYNGALGSGIDVLFGGGRRHFVPETTTDEEGSSGSRTDGRDLRAEFQAQGYTYVSDQTGFDALGSGSGRVIGLFESSHMEYEFDRPNDTGGEPSIAEMTRKAVQILEGMGAPYYLMVESGRIDHAHHAGNAFRNFIDTMEFDRAIGNATAEVNLDETLIMVTADHSHVFTMAGYPLRPVGDLAYTPAVVPPAFADMPYGGIFGTVYDINSSGEIVQSTDSDGVPYTILGYANGPGYRSGMRVDPDADTTPGLDGVVPPTPHDAAYLQEATVPLGSETHSAEDVAIYAIGAGASTVRGTVPNTIVFTWIRDALGL